MKLHFNTAVAILCMSSFILFTGCSNGSSIKLGKPIPKNAEIVKLTDVIAAPQQFNGKTVVLQGVISGQCPSLCEFFFKEGPHQVTIFPQGYKFPKLPQGKPVTVLANITAGNENIVFSALGLQL